MFRSFSLISFSLLLCLCITITFWFLILQSFQHGFCSHQACTWSQHCTVQGASHISSGERQELRCPAFSLASHWEAEYIILYTCNLYACSFPKFASILYAWSYRSSCHRTVIKKSESFFVWGSQSFVDFSLLKYHQSSLHEDSLSVTLLLC